MLQLVGVNWGAEGGEEAVGELLIELMPENSRFLKIFPTPSQRM